MTVQRAREGQFSYFSHRECEYFPCHAGADPDNFNCLFCFCPLYLLGRRCGGSFKYTSQGVKQCRDCLFPHKRENYRVVIERYAEILALLKDLDRNGQEEKSAAQGGQGESK